MSEKQSAKAIIDRLGLEPHPEGGWFRETFRDSAQLDNGRSASTAIYFLLQAGEFSHWHRVDAVEVWHFYAGDPLVLSISENGVDARSLHLGAEFSAYQQPQIVVPANAWQAAETLGRWTLVGCTVAPGFDFAHFELAPPDWRPEPRGQ
ncbi:MAG: cupin domain-containing protein [Pseudomonadota bacterium]